MMLSKLLTVMLAFALGIALNPVYGQGRIQRSMQTCWILRS